jgi:hypothetical protein
MRRILIACALLVGVAAVARAEDKAPAPGPDTERLGFFVGKWKTTGEMKETAFGPGGKFTAKESCEWFSGKFSLVCKSKGKGPTGPTEGLGIMAYNSEEKVYVYYGVDNGPMAMTTVPRGSFADDAWSYEDESKMGGQMVKSRYVMKKTGKKSYTSSWSIQGPDGQWKTVMEATSTRD